MHHFMRATITKFVRGAHSIPAAADLWTVLIKHREYFSLHHAYPNYRYVLCSENGKGSCAHAGLLWRILIEMYGLTGQGRVSEGASGSEHTDELYRSGLI